MALLDVNVLLALTWDQHIHHRAARSQFGSVAARFMTTPITESGLVRLLLTPTVVGRPVTAAEAEETLGAIRRLSGWRWLDDDASFVGSTLDLRVLVARKQVTDLHLVNLAARHGTRLVTFDAAIAEWLAPTDRRHVVTWQP